MNNNTRFIFITQDWAKSPKKNAWGTGQISATKSTVPVHWT